MCTLMNSYLHHTVVMARLADFSRVAEAERRLHRAAPPPAPQRDARRSLLRRRTVRAAA